MGRWFERRRHRSETETPDRFVARQEPLFDPGCEVTVTDSAYKVLMDLPGVHKQDMELRLEGDRLVIEGVREGDPLPDEETLILCQRGHGSFVRTFILPRDADGTETKANLEDGVLELVIPKRPFMREARLGSA